VFRCRRWQADGVCLAECFRGEESHAIATPGVQSASNGVAVSRDGSTLLLSDYGGGSHAIHEFHVADGSRLRVIGKTKSRWFGGCAGDGRLQFSRPHQVWVASDDHVFVADYGNDRVQVLTPTLDFHAVRVDDNHVQVLTPCLDFHAFVGVGQLHGPSGVCADDDIAVVSEETAHRISVFSRRDDTLVRRFGSKGSGDGQLNTPRGLCFMAGHRHVAVADQWNHRVSVFTVDGGFVRHVGVGELSYPQGVACSAFNELVVADWGNRRVVVFTATRSFAVGDGCFTGVAIHGGTIFAQDHDNSKCILFN
jgi:DNA-binding beta-propeller fold protein YncE